MNNDTVLERKAYSINRAGVRTEWFLVSRWWGGRIG